MRACQSPREGFSEQGDPRGERRDDTGTKVRRRAEGAEAKRNPSKEGPKCFSEGADALAVDDVEGWWSAQEARDFVDGGGVATSTERPSPSRPQSGFRERAG